MNKSYTDLEQSKKLAEILPLDSADMYYYLDPTPAGNIYHLVAQRVDFGIKNLPQYNEGDIPCWSLAALLEIIPNVEIKSKVRNFDKESWCVSSHDDEDHNHIWVYNDELVDACVELIYKLKELNHDTTRT